MSGHVDLDGVLTWYDDRGSGDPVVLLHGGLTDSRDFDGNLDRLAGRFRLLMPDRRGHGRTPDVPGPSTVDLWARDTVRFIEKVAGGPVRLAGYSAGATTALTVAVRRPDLVDRLVLVSGAFAPDGMTVRPQAGAPMPEPLVAAYAEVSPDGRDHFGVIVAKVAEGIDHGRALTADELAAVGCPVLVMTADDDFVTLEHSVALYRALPRGQLAIVPNTSHLLLHERPELCAAMVGEFLGADPAPRLMPLTRAGG